MLILELDDPQAELYLLRSCHNICKINHLLRTVPCEIILNQLGKFDEMSDPHSLELAILHSPIPDDAWSQAVLSFSYGGLGLGEAKKIAPAAFTESLTTVMSLVVQLLTNSPTDDFILQGKSSSKKMLFDVIAQNKAVLPDQLTQSTLRHLLHSLSFDHLLVIVILTFVTRFALMLFQQVEKQAHCSRLPQSLLLGWIYQVQNSILPSGSGSSHHLHH